MLSFFIRITNENVYQVWSWVSQFWITLGIYWFVSIKIMKIKVSLKTWERPLKHGLRILYLHYDTLNTYWTLNFFKIYWLPTLPVSISTPERNF